MRLSCRGTHLHVDLVIVSDGRGAASRFLELLQGLSESAHVSEELLHKLKEPAAALRGMAAVSSLEKTRATT